MKSFLTAASLVALAAGQYDDWTCNHYGSFVPDVCYQFSSAYAYLFTCNGTDMMNFAIYTDGTCGTTDGDVYSSVTYDESSDTSDTWDCSQSSSCDYAIVRYYYDEDCTGDSYVDTPWIMDQCYDSSIISGEYSCSGSKITTTLCSGSGCSDSCTSVTIDYEAYSDTYSGCYEVTCAGSSDAMTNTAFGAFVAVVAGLLYRLF